jgi:hypothetical protein
MNVAMFGLLGFFIISSAYRAFRARGIDAFVILFTAALVMLGQAPLGQAIWDPFASIGNWFLNIPNVAGNRAILIGVAIGTIAIAFEIMLGYERGWLGKTEA